MTGGVAWMTPARPQDPLASLLPPHNGGELRWKRRCGTMSWKVRSADLLDRYTMLTMLFSDLNRLLAKQVALGPRALKPLVHTRRDSSGGRRAATNDPRR
jgi:hypothetical protein